MRIPFCALEELRARKRITKWIDELRDEITALDLGNRIVVRSSVCLHMGGEFTVDWERKQFCCRWHDWRFDVETGDCVTFPLPGRRLREYAWEEDGGQLVLCGPATC